MQNKHKRTGLGVVAAILVLCALASMAVLFSRITTYTQAKYVHVLPLIDENNKAAEPNKATSATVTLPSLAEAEETTAPTQAANTAGSAETKKHPAFEMEAEAEIFRLSYDNDSGETTVIGVEGNTDKLIAPGTSNLYQFTLQNPGDVSLDYTLTMEAYVTGTDLWLPVNARVWDYTNKYLVGSAEEMADVMELNTVNESAELGAGRYAVYNLEWEWPFEWGNDEYDTMLGNLAVEDDLVLHIVIRTVAEYDEKPDNPNAGTPPKTGDDSQIVLFALLCAGAFVGLCIMLIPLFKSKRKDDSDQTK